MQKRIGLAAIIVVFSLCTWSQTKPATTPPKRAPAAAAPTADPTAIIRNNCRQNDLYAIPAK